MVLTDKLAAIGNAIRAKTGEVDLLTLDEMPAAIEGIVTGGGDIPEEGLNLTGDFSYRFAYDGWTWFINTYGRQIKTSNLNGGGSYFTGCYNLESIPFDLNFNGDEYYNKGTDMFLGCNHLKDIGDINNLYPSQITGMFKNCNNLRYLPVFNNLNLTAIHTSNAINHSMFDGCYSLREIPENLAKELYSSPNSTYNVYHNLFQNCCSLDEIKNLGVSTGTLTANRIANLIRACYRLKNFTFNTQEDGSPIVARWGRQVLNFADENGWPAYITGVWRTDGFVGQPYNATLNNGITADKEVKDDATYQALKNDPDWFSSDVAYSRYNHDSAVNTINSLPDCSAYIASQSNPSSAMNTIIFKGEAGSKTDGGAINTLTEAEIAVASAKGWTVSLV